jgi:FixJ family two-component response regulator
MSRASGGVRRESGTDRDRLIAVVDDDTSVLRSLKNLLTSTCRRVEVFGSAEAFLESEHLGETGCLLLDLRMPGMGGAELFSRLIAAERAIPTIILTAVSEDEERQRLLNRGAVAYLTKPFRAADILLAVREALEKDLSV